MPVANLTLRPAHARADQFKPLKPREMEALVSSIHSSLDQTSAAGGQAKRVRFRA
jgi:hypothetical protein